MVELNQKEEGMQSKMPEISYKDIANYYIALANDSGETLTNLKLQKLVYYAQAWYLANFKAPLFNKDFEAWVHGPVIPDLYREYKKFGYGPIVTDIDFDAIKPLERKISGFLYEVARVYMPIGAFELESMTHQEDPWIEARGDCKPDENCNNVISQKSMMNFYASKIST